MFICIFYRRCTFGSSLHHGEQAVLLQHEVHHVRSYEPRSRVQQSRVDWRVREHVERAFSYSQCKKNS